MKLSKTDIKVCDLLSHVIIHLLVYDSLKEFKYMWWETHWSIFLPLHRLILLQVALVYHDMGLVPDVEDFFVFSFKTSLFRSFILIDKIKVKMKVFWLI